AQGEADELFVVDNGMKPDLRDWLASRATLIPAEGAGIHRMWNLGVMAALSRHPKANIAFLNDDIRIGEKFLSGLAEPLRDDDQIIAVCPNYDGRDQIVDVLPLEGICGERYDGTGGFSGFAYMVKGEWFHHYRFPEQCKWWSGAGAPLACISAAGGCYAMVTGVEVEHLDGGGKTGNWSDPAMQAQLAADRAAFAALVESRGWTMTPKDAA